jgi:deazaflavin-dependent oxidoreductase (nitroreductase family)
VNGLARFLRRYGNRRWFVRLARAYVPVDRVVGRFSRGRLVALGLRDLPSFLLTTTGRRTGEPRTVPLLYLVDGADFIVIASNFGQRHHPAWSANLLADPSATVYFDGRAIGVYATLVQDAERDRLIAALREMWPAYATYEIWASNRTLRVFRLTEV